MHCLKTHGNAWRNRPTEIISPEIDEIVGDTRARVYYQTVISRKYVFCATYRCDPIHTQRGGGFVQKGYRKWECLCEYEFSSGRKGRYDFVGWATHRTDQRIVKILVFQSMHQVVG